MELLVTGDRLWKNYLIIAHAISALYADNPSLIVIHGAARGADLMADYVARQLNITRRALPADWATYGKAAGPIRNQLMLTQNPAISLVYAFHDDIYTSKGTKDMIMRSLKAHKQVVLFTSKGDKWQVNPQKMENTKKTYTVEEQPFSLEIWKNQ